MRHWCTSARKSHRRASRDPPCRAGCKYAHGLSVYASLRLLSAARLRSSARRLPSPSLTTAAVKVAGAAVQTRAVALHTKAMAATTVNRAPLRQRRPGAADQTVQAPVTAKPPPATPKGTGNKTGDPATPDTATAAKVAIAALAAVRPTEQVNQKTATAVETAGAATAHRAPANRAPTKPAVSRAPGKVTVARTRERSSRRHNLAQPQVLRAQRPVPPMPLSSPQTRRLRRLRLPLATRPHWPRRHCLRLALYPAKLRPPAPLTPSHRRMRTAGTRF